MTEPRSTIAPEKREKVSMNKVNMNVAFGLTIFVILMFIVMGVALFRPPTPESSRSVAERTQAQQDKSYDLEQQRLQGDTITSGPGRVR